MNVRPTLLVFTLGPELERTRRRLLPEHLNAVERRLHERCLASTLDAGHRCGWRLWVSSPQPVRTDRTVRHCEQPSGSFGARFRSALTMAFDRARGPVVVVGSDVPGLGSSHLRQAVDALAADPDGVVVGPSRDGGFYLLAAARPLDDELAAVRWQTPEALESLCRALERSGRRVFRLAPLADLDRPVDLATWVARTRVAAGPWRELIGLLRSALAEMCAAPSRARLGAPRVGLVTVPLGRAPPRLAA